MTIKPNLENHIAGSVANPSGPVPQQARGNGVVSTTAPQALIAEAEDKAAEFQLGKLAADIGCPPRGWNVDHPCEFGVFQRGRDGYAVAPLFPAVLTDMRRDGFRCIYRTDQ